MVRGEKRSWSKLASFHLPTAVELRGPVALSLWEEECAWRGSKNGAHRVAVRMAEPSPTARWGTLGFDGRRPLSTDHG